MNRNDRIVALTRELFTDDHIVRLAEVFGQTPDKVAEMLQRSNTYGSRDVFLLRVLKLVQEHGLMDEALAAIQDEKDLLKASLRQSRPTVGREKEIADRMAAGEAKAAIARDIGCSTEAVSRAYYRHVRPGTPVHTD